MVEERLVKVSAIFSGYSCFTVDTCKLADTSVESVPRKVENNHKRMAELIFLSLQVMFKISENKLKQVTELIEGHRGIEK